MLLNSILKDLFQGMLPLEVLIMSFAWNSRLSMLSEDIYLKLFFYVELRVLSVKG